MGVTLARALPWTDRAGRFSWLRAAVLALLLLPGTLLLTRWATEGLGPEPIEEAMHDTGRWAIRFLFLALAVTPTGRVFAWPRLLQLRRMVGLAALGYACVHLLLYVGEQGWVLPRVASEISSRFYLAIGFAALCGLVVLGVTSTDGWMKRLGRGWKKLHRVIFLLTPLALWHAFLQGKTDVTQAVLLAGALAWLMAWRALPAAWQGRIPALLGLAVVAALGAAAAEYLWYALATNLPAGRILAANLDLGFGPRPAAWVGIIAVAVALLVGLRRLAAPGRAA